MPLKPTQIGRDYPPPRDFSIFESKLRHQWKEFFQKMYINRLNCSCTCSRRSEKNKKGNKSNHVLSVWSLTVFCHIYELSAFVQNHWHLPHSIFVNVVYTPTWGNLQFRNPDFYLVQNPVFSCLESCIRMAESKFQAYLFK